MITKIAKNERIVNNIGTIEVKRIEHYGGVIGIV